MEGSGITVGTAHADDSNPPAAAAPQLEPDDILMSVAMSRLCMQSDRVIRAVRREAHHHHHDPTEECDDIVSMGEETNADIVGALSADVWQRWLDVVRKEIGAMQGEDERMCAWYRKPGTEEDDLAHLENVMRKLSDVWRLRDHVLGYMDEKSIDEDVNSEWMEKTTVFLMCSIGAEELEEEGLHTTRMIRGKLGDGCLPALEGWLGGQRSVAWWMRESTPSS